MKDSRGKTNLLPGVLRRGDFKCACTVALVTKLTQNETPTVGVWNRIRIVSVDQLPPDGTYQLEVHGRIFEVELQGGKSHPIKL